MDHKVPLWWHQKKAVEDAKSVRHMALFWEMGTGKTAALINILRYRYQHGGRLMKTLIFAPLATLENWREEFFMHSNINPAYVIVLNGSQEKRKRALAEACEYNPGRVVITNYHATQMDDLMRMLFVWHPDILVCDESHLLKSPSADRSRVAAKFAAISQYRYILTGTPILNSPMDVFQQMLVLDNGETFGKNFWSFKATYFIDLNKDMPKHIRFPNWQPKANTFKELNSKIYKKGSRVLKSECLDLPPLIRQVRHIKMGSAQQKAYDQMKESFVAFLDAPPEGKPSQVIAQMAMTKALRLQQIASGFVPDEDGEIHSFAPKVTKRSISDVKERNQELRDLLEQLTPHHKVIVWACFHENYKQIREVCESLDIEYRELHGQIRKAEDKQRNLVEFRSDDKVRVMIANQAAGGVGVNMTEASYSIYYSRSFALGDDLQSEARNHRGGSEMHEKITRIDLIVPGTIDESVLYALKGKKKISDEIMAWRDKV